MDDDKIIDLFLSRDERAISETSASYGAFLFRSAKKITENDNDAEECVNDTYLQAWDRIPPDEPRGYFRAYLFRILRHIALDKCRKRNADKRSAVVTEMTEELSEVISDGTDAQSELEYKDLGELINAFLKKQKEPDRSIFILRYYNTESVTDISKRLQMNENKVKAILFRMRGRLKKYLESEGYQI